MGVYQTSTVDISLATSGFPLQAARVYTSSHGVDGPTGLGWSSSFHSRLHYITYLFAAPSTYRTEAEVILPDGEHLEFLDDGSGGFVPPTGRYDTLVRNGDGTWEFRIQLSRSKLLFSADGLLTSMVDDYGNTLTFTYDIDGRLQRVSDISGTGRFLDVFWGANGRISSIQDSSGRTVHYAYDVFGMLTSITNPAGQTTSYSYVVSRSSRVLSRIVDYWGRIITDVTWDGQGRVSSYTESGETYTYEHAFPAWGGDSLKTSKMDSSGNRWIFPYDSSGLITQRAQPQIAFEVPSSYTTYYPDGSVERETDEVGIKTYYTYAGSGRVASVTKNYQGSPSVRFDYSYDTTFSEKVVSILPRNPATGLNDPNWQGWKYDYYPTGSVASGALHHVYRVRDDGVTSDLMATYTYDTKGRVTSTTDAAGSVTDYGYDSVGDLVTITSPANNDAGIRPVTTYGYDALGRVTSVTDPLGKTTTYTYDALDRVLTVTLPKPAIGSTLEFTTTYSYDNYEAGSTLLFVHVTDPNGNVTKQGYDQFGRLRKSIDALSQTTHYAYPKDLLSSITDANGNVTGYEYDARKRLSATVFPNGGRETYSYYADGLLKTKTDRKNQTITYTYDSYKRLKQKTYPNGTYIQYTYSGQKLTQVVDYSMSPAETHALSYDSSFRMTSNTQATRGTIGYSYAANDALATMTLTGGPTTTYSYYPDGSLNTIGWSPVTGQFKYAYRLNGQYQTLTLPNGQTRGYNYDDQGRPLQIANLHPTAGNLATFDYAYDLNHATAAYDRLGQRVSMTANVPSQGLSGALTQYQYDANYQLTQVNYPSAAPFNGEVHSWTDDPIGNRLTNTINGTTTNYAYQMIGTNRWQRMTSDGARAYTYDANGNTATQGSYNFGWDYENRMVSISGGASATYKYDYQGRRTSKTAGAATTYVYDGLNLVSEAGASSTSYLFGPGIDEPLAMERGGTISYFAPDALGSITFTGDPAGSTQNAYVYDAWGSARSATEAVPQPFRYTAREVGEVPSQWFYRARFYSSPVGRFLSEDPLGMDDLMNLYEYVVNDPVALTDPTGLAYDYCVVVSSRALAYGPVTNTQVTPIPQGARVTLLQPVVRRECYFRCYCSRPNTCYKRPHPGHNADHGVSIREVTVSRSRTTPAPKCSTLLKTVKDRGVCD